MAIKWKWDGKTVELQNTEPSTYQEQQVALPLEDTRNEERKRAENLLFAAGKASSDKERAALIKRETRAQERQWREQQRAFYKAMQGGLPDYDVASGVQEMIDSGAIIEEEEGFSSPIPDHNKTRVGAMVRAHDAYVDWMKSIGNTQYDPDRGGWYNPDVGLPMVPDSGGRLIVRRPDGAWMPAFGDGMLNDD